jgi:hypothetical protein
MDAIVRGSLNQALKILLSLAPLFAFWFIALGNSLLLLDIGLIVGTVLLVILAMARLTRGTLLWATALFFGPALVLVVGLNNVWVIAHLGIFPTSILFVAVLLSMVLGRPFIQEYAGGEVPEEVQASAGFVRTCFVLTSFWAAILLLMALVSALQLYYRAPDPLFYVFVQLAILVAALAYQADYLVQVRRRRLSMVGARSERVSSP